MHLEKETLTEGKEYVCIERTAWAQEMEYRSLPYRRGGRAESLSVGCVKHCALQAESYLSNAADENPVLLRGNLF